MSGFVIAAAAGNALAPCPARRALSAPLAEKVREALLPLEPEGEPRRQALRQRAFQLRRSLYQVTDLRVRGLLQAEMDPDVAAIWRGEAPTLRRGFVLEAGLRQLLLRIGSEDPRLDRAQQERRELEAARWRE